VTIASIGVIEQLMQRLAPSERAIDGARALIQEASDRIAGVWIVERTLARHTILDAAISLQTVKGYTWRRWQELAADPNFLQAQIVRAGQQAEHSQLAETESALCDSIQAYRLERDAQDFWKKCLGKEVLGILSGRLFSNRTLAMLEHVAELWAVGNPGPPPEVLDLREYFSKLVV
jgi:hypothetical protein